MNNEKNVPSVQALNFYRMKNQIFKYALKSIDAFIKVQCVEPRHLPHSQVLMRLF